MDGENNGKAYFLWDDLGGFPPIFGSTPILMLINRDGIYHFCIHLPH